MRTQFCIKRGERLIQQQHLGSHYKAARKCHALTLATRHLIGHPVFKPAKLYQFKRFGNAVAGLRLRYARYPQAIAHIVGHVHMRKHGVALEHHVHGPLVRRDKAHILSVDDDLPFGWHFEPGNHPKQRGFATARWPKQNEKFPSANIEADIVHRSHFAETFGHVADFNDGLFAFGHKDLPLLMGFSDALHALIFQRDEGQGNGKYDQDCGRGVNLWRDREAHH